MTTTAVPATMRAVVLDAPGPPEALRVREIPVPTPRAGEVLISTGALGQANGGELPLVTPSSAVGIMRCAAWAAVLWSLRVR